LFLVLEGPLEMKKGRLEAFSDGVLAVIFTIMVLEMKSPNGRSLASLRPVIPVLLTYILSFVYIGIYWNNHHHLLHATQRVNGATLWARPPSSSLAVAGSIRDRLDGRESFRFLAGRGVRDRALITLHGESSILATSIGRDTKAKISINLCGSNFACIYETMDCRLLLPS